ncbi:RHS repeat-associated core domain-containing protein [Ruminococcus callidus]|uniref:RHS repeat-associated core domain-containing protein n=1 Tax=Ruminococcus callidus TaxID=40519 RepID=UPI0023F0F484|nr:RHS repeat-associated core domain-containing protein [Ruminococcus callidus]
MNKKLTRILAGVLSLMFMGQVMVFGDGSAQGLLHADTIASAAEAIEGAKNKDQLAKEFEEATKDLGKVDFFDVPEAVNQNVMAYNSTEVQTEAASDFTWDGTAKSYIQYLKELSGSQDAATLTVTGKVQKGTVDGYATSDNTPIYVRIFNGNWEEIAYQEISDGGEYTVTAGGSDAYHVKFECDGYLPFYLKDFGTGAYQIGSGKSWDTVTLVPGDTTWNEENDNQWSDDVLNSSDASYVESCRNAYRGDPGFNPSMDHDEDGMVSDADWDYFYRLYEELGEDEFYDMNQLDMYQYDLDNNGVINYYDLQLKQKDTGATEAELADFASIVKSARDYESPVFVYNHYYTNDGKVDAEDYNEGIDKINEQIKLRDRSSNYYEYMDKDNSGIIDDFDINWFSDAQPETGSLDWDHAFKRNLKMLSGGMFPYSFNLHDTNFDLNGCILYVADCMSFTTDMPQFWSGNGATLNINSGVLLIENNLVFRTASPDEWSGKAGQLMNLNGGAVLIGNCFDFGQANCYDTIEMTNNDDILMVGGNWTYNTLTNMEGKWTAGNIWVLGPTWEVNEKSGAKAVYSSGTQVIHFGYAGGKQTVLWDNCETYINNEDGSLNTERTFNFDGGIDFIYDFTAENYWFRPWWRPYDEPDYTLYRKGWEMGDGVHIATGNYTKSFTDLSVESPGVQSDFIRTYNSTSNEEGSFGIGWDFNIDVSKIVKPAAGYYQVVLPDGSNTTFKDNGKGGFECLNAHSTMTKSGNEYTITNAAQSKYHFNTNGELDWVKDAEGNVLTISSMTNNQRIVTDSTGRTYTITYNGNKEHSRITSIEDTAAGRVVTYAYNGDFQLVSATSVSGGTESYEYDGKGRLCKITNCYDEMTDQIVYNDNGSVNWLTNASGLKQVYTYDKTQKQTGLKEYDGDTLVKTYTYNYDERYAVKTNTVETDGQTYEVDKITYTMVDGENKYDEMSESVDIMGNTTKYERDTNGNVIKTINADGTYTLANYNDKNSVIAEVDESGNATIKAYDSNGTRLLKEATSLHPLSQTDINTVTADNFDPVKYLAANEASYAITSHEYYADSYVSGIAGLIRATTDPEGNVTEYDYYKDGYGKGLVKSKTLKDGNTIVSTVTYEYNAQLQVSKETTSYDLSQNLYSVKEYEYDKFNNVTVTRDYGTGSTPATTIAEYDLLSRKTAEYAPNYSADKSHGSLTIYYPDGNKKSETDAEGNITSYVYDAYGQVIKKTNPDGTMNLTAYDGLQREKATYFLGSENGTKQILTKTSYEFAGYNFDIYSALDASASHSCKGLKTTKTTYITENKQVISEMLTDIKEHTIYEKTNGETKRTSAYYANGQLARQTDALGNITKYEYGYLNKVTKTYTPFNTKSDGSVNYSVTENQYDKNGNVTLAKQTVQKQDSDTVKYSVTENQYNAQGLLTQVTLSGTGSSEKNITQYFYNNAGIQTKMYTGLSSANDTDYMTTNYEYDAWGHLVRTTDSTGYNSGATTYDLNGNALTVTDANGNVTTNTYDALNRVLTANTICSDTSKNVSKSYVYDNMGRVRSKTVNEVQTSYQYDNLGRVYQELSPKSFKGYFYEGISQYAKEQLVGINHQTMYSSTQYEYDAEMRIAQVKESGNLTATYTYDANGNKISETLANGVVSTYSYNGCNKVTKLVTKSGNSDISSYEYSYYLDGSDACKVRNENGTIETTSYDYDGLKRLTRESISNGKTADTYSYEYDDYGNRSKMVANGSEEYETVYDYTVNGKYTALLQKEIKTVEETSNATISDGLAISPTDLITSTAADAKTEETAYSYDANGNQITKTAEGKTETNTYDGLNQLIGFTDGETTTSYKYNADGLRTSKTVDGKTINHIWDDNKQIVVDMDDSDWYSAEVYVRGTNLLAKFSKQSGNVKTDYQYYTQNAHGDVVDLTDADGEIVKLYTYDAFGVEKNIDDADTNAFRYCGEYYDSESGTIYLRARYYDPTIGRFISRDSYAGKNEDPLSLNLYNYCANNPVYFNDFSGHWFGLDDAIAAGIGAIAGGVGQLASDLAKSAITGELKFSDWQTYTGAVVGGAIGGACSLYVSPAVGAAIGSGASTLIGQTLQYTTGAEDAPESYGQVLFNTGMSCLTGAVFSKIPHASSKTPTAYFSGKAYDSGMNSLSILYAQTSSVRDTVRTITTNTVWKNTTKKTVSNGIINQAISSAEEGAYDAVKSVLVDLALVESNDSRKVARSVFKWAS